MDYPKEITAIAKRVMKKYPNDVALAAQEGLQQIKKLPCYKQFAETAVLIAFTRCIYLARSVSNRAVIYHISGGRTPTMDSVVRKTANPARIKKFGENSLVKKMYSYYYGGMQVADMTGADLKRFVLKARAEGEFSMRQAAWFEALQKVTPDDVTVGKAVPEAVMAKIAAKVGWEGELV